MENVFAVPPGSLRRVCALLRATVVMAAQRRSCAADPGRSEEERGGARRSEAVHEGRGARSEQESAGIDHSLTGLFIQKEEGAVWLDP